MRTTLYVPHAIVFVYDLSGNGIDVPEYVDDDLIASNETCISIGTKSDVDGEVTVDLIKKADHVLEKNYTKVFKGFINTLGKKVAVSTSEIEGILATNVDTIKTEVSIWVNDSELPSMIFIEVE